MEKQMEREMETVLRQWPLGIWGFRKSRGSDLQIPVIRTHMRTGFRVYWIPNHGKPCIAPNFSTPDRMRKAP